MKNISILFTLFVLLILFSCDDKTKELVLNDKYCKANWAICSILNSKAIKNSSDERIIKIAILDSGINDNHSALKGLVKSSYNAINDSLETQDFFGHGTAIAGIIAAKPNKENVTGILSNVQLFDVQVLDEKGRGKIESVIKGIQWSIEQDVDIINMSFGFQNDSDLLKAAIKEALNQGIVIVAAAGNTFGLYTDYPAKYEGVLSISAIDVQLQHYSLAATGKIDFVAPGVDIPILGEINNEHIVSGTSFATAYATSIIAYHLSKSSNSDIFSSEVIAIKNVGNKKYNGHGMLYIP
ncbi:S8 family serine peptidase [Sporosarcina sp. FSL K6-3457]|uniref:S8 family serine peptidase n=1 Tax=Sporosarcina sp. FSL K6-3457 TaxID=2978204 RepID=UPI0030F5F08A